MPEVANSEVSMAIRPARNSAIREPRPPRESAQKLSTSTATRPVCSSGMNSSLSAADVLSDKGNPGCITTSGQTSGRVPSGDLRADGRARRSRNIPDLQPQQGTAERQPGSPSVNPSADSDAGRGADL